MTEQERKRLITWGVDGYGRRFFLCDCCGKEFGFVDYYEIKHKCPKKRK